MRDLDLVTDRNYPRKLLRFASEDVDQSFRIDVKIQGGVMFLCRWEAEFRRIVLGSQALVSGCLRRHNWTAYPWATQFGYTRL